MDDRAALTDILLVLRTGIPWELLPVEMDCESGMTYWRWPHEWRQAGVWDRPHRFLLDRLGYVNAINWERGDRAEPDGPRQTGLQAPHP